MHSVLRNLSQMTCDSVFFWHLLGSSRLNRLKGFIPRLILIVLPYICASDWPADIGSSIHSWRFLVWYEGRYTWYIGCEEVTVWCIEGWVWCFPVFPAGTFTPSLFRNSPDPDFLRLFIYLFILRLYCTGLLLIRRKTQIYLFRFFLASVQYYLFQDIEQEPSGMRRIL